MLVIDDEAFNHAVMQSMFVKKGYEVDVAHSGKKALKLIEERLDVVYSHQG